MSPPRTSRGWREKFKSLIITLALLTVSLDDLTLGGASARNQRLINDDLSTWLPPIPTKRKQQPKFRKLPTNKRDRRRAMYAKVQTAYRKNRAQCADTVLSGAWEVEDPEITLAAQEPFWRPLFETPSSDDPRIPNPVRDVQWETVDPFTVKEVRDALRTMSSKSAPGPDARSIKALKKIPIQQIVSRFNLWLLAGCLPSTLYEGYTALIPKVPGTDDPAKFRPITVSSVLTRLYHKTISKRIEDLCPPGIRQKAYRSGDGIAENTTILTHILKQSQNAKSPKPLYLAFLDVSKAFDSVSHFALFNACRRAGIPEPLIMYIKQVYLKSTTRLRVGETLSETIRALQGVKQGDPLSGILFNLVIDWALSALDPLLGFKLDDLRVNHMAFADDVILLSETKAGLQRQIDSFTNHLAKSGLKVNAKKCSSLSIVVQGKTKKWVCDPNPAFNVFGTDISPMSIDDMYKYLGLYFSPTGSNAVVEEKLKKQLRELSRAPLKPQQRMWILSTKVIPSLFHQLVLSNCTKGLLATLDKYIRSAVRQWTKLPKDTPLPFFYAHTKDGGLGLQALEYVVPSLKHKRMLNLKTSDDPVVRKIVALESFEKTLRKWGTPIKFEGHLMSNTAMRRQAFKETLYSRVDGKGLQHASLVPFVHDWVSAGTSLMSGRKFNASLAVRASTLYTRARASRGRPDADPWCDCCRSPQRETLNHILQKCPRTYKPRITRHDRVLEETEKAFRKLGYQTVLEHHFKTSAGMRKPDLLAWAPGKPTIITDVTIVSDQYVNLDDPHNAKVEYYKKHPEITAQAIDITGNPPWFSGIAINWRGCFSPKSAADLLNMGLSKRTLGLLSAIAVEQSAITHRIFGQSTMRI